MPGLLDGRHADPEDRSGTQRGAGTGRIVRLPHVRAVGADGGRHVGPVVHDEQDPGPAADRAELRRERPEVSLAELRRAQLDRRRAAADRREGDVAMGAPGERRGRHDVDAQRAGIRERHPRSRATARSRLNFFQSLSLPENRTSVTIVSTPNAAVTATAHPGAFVAGEIATAMNGAIFVASAPLAWNHARARRIRQQVRRVVGLQARPGRRRPSQEGVRVRDPGEAPVDPVGRHVHAHRPGDPGGDQGETGPRPASRRRPGRWPRRPGR